MISNLAIIENGASIGKNCSIGPYSIIRKDVVIGDNNIIGPHVVIEGKTIIGNNNKFFQFCSIGSTPQVLDYIEGDSKLVIGDNNSFREFVTVQPGVEKHGGITKIGDKNLFMISSHIGHDSIIGDNNRFTNYVGVSGHAQIGNNVIIGGFTGIHQFVRLGDYAFIGAGSVVTMDVPNFCLAQGNHASLIQINTVGLEREGFDSLAIDTLRKLFRELFFNDGTFESKFSLASQKFFDKHSISMLEFISTSKRGIVPYRKKACQER